MITLWIGDFRLKQLQNIYAAAQQTAEYQYLVEDLAEYSWFATNAVLQIPTMSLDKANVVVALGFNDCVYSCVWDTFNIELIAKQYATVINDLIKEYPTFNFYVCSINPIDAGYPFAESATGVIQQKQLTDKIKLFNKTIKSDCTATYVDSNTYLMDTGFASRDGIRYNSDTCSILHNYITANITSVATADFLPRISAPDPEVDSYVYWAGTSDGGENPFTMPSSAAYAWGRFYEITGKPPRLSHADSEYWYSYTTDGYKRGDVPKLGAIACWQNGAPGGSDYGYVAVVEQVKDDGSIITSEVDTTGTWLLADRVKGSGNWGMTDTYHFQGFIYCPLTVSASKEELCVKNSYNVTLEEMKPNAEYIYAYLSEKGWSLNAVAGLLGNLQVESKMSPASWENTIDGSIIKADGTQELNMTIINSFYNSHGRYPGYGLTQWTPYTNFTNWCTNKGLDYWDIDSHLQRIDWEVEHGDQWIARPSKGYDITFNEFITSTRDAAWLAEVFAFCYERPGSSTGTEAEQNALRAERGENGEFWYNYLSALSLDISDTKVKISGFKVDSCTATQVSISALFHNADSVECILLKNGVRLADKELAIKTGYKTFTFDNLTPNTEYTISLEAAGSDEEITVRELSFTTHQSYPEAAKNVEFTTTDIIRGANSKFTLKVTKADQLGYWKAISGYDISLIVNNKVVKTLTVDNASQDLLWENISLKDKFAVESRAADIIQIGVKSWVKTTSGQKLYCENLKCSQPICLLNKPISVYLNK